MASEPSKSSMRAVLHRWLLGPGSTFRNGNRTWLYLGFLLLTVGIVAVASLVRG